ncbi:cation transporter [Nitzschia inconspicua]|uniref:Cation transporter n=1 Tax=Nitzschia inconspicua TaxID=303405 RepID=A0A9K3KK76_9STRA|nr:cation transporter [Nitzschia inconspicua]KAG7344836.1 cation transporter [Nitzschia inconspicua]
MEPYPNDNNINTNTPSSECQYKSKTVTLKDPPATNGGSRKKNTTDRFTSLNDFIKRTYGSTLSVDYNNNNNNNNNIDDDTTDNGGGGANEMGVLMASLLGNSNNNNNNNNTPAADDTTLSSGLSGSDSDQGGGSSNHHNMMKCWSLRRLALELSLWANVFITLTKLVAYIRTLSLSVLAALLDSVLDVVSQLVLNFTEKHSSMQRSSAHYPAGASRLEPIGVLTCAALMGMASFEVLKESFQSLIRQESALEDLTRTQAYYSCGSMISIVVVKLLLLALCQKASYKRSGYGSSKSVVQYADPTLEALAQDHWNDALSNGVSAVSLFMAIYWPSLWWVDSVGAVIISLYIIYSWYHTGQEQIEQLTGKSAPQDFIEELQELAANFDRRIQHVDQIRAYHFGPKFLVELEIVMPHNTPLKESHDLGMELQYEIEAREEVERCFVHIDYEARDYDEHVVSKVPELREHLLRNRTKKNIQSAMSV